MEFFWRTRESLIWPIIYHILMNPKFYSCLNKDHTLYFSEEAECHSEMYKYSFKRDCNTILLPMSNSPKCSLRFRILSEILNAPSHLRSTFLQASVEVYDSP